MKPRHLALVVACAFACQGCMITSAVVQKARGESHWNTETKREESKGAKPGYYALVPLSFAADVVTSPYQFVALGVYFWQ